MFQFAALRLIPFANILVRDDETPWCKGC